MNLSFVQTGLVTTHLGFLTMTGDPYGCGRPHVVTGMERLTKLRPMPDGVIQFPVFPNMTDGSNNKAVDELVTGLKGMCKEIVPIIMFDADPHGDDGQQEQYVTTLTAGLSWAGKHGCRRACATLYEKWMSGNPRVSDSNRLKDMDNRLGKLVGAAYKKAKAAGAIPDELHAEGLRPGWRNGVVCEGEFSTYTSLDRWVLGAHAINTEIGGDKPFVLVLPDAAHIGDSRMSVAEIRNWLKRMVSDKLGGIAHASAPTTRGCLHTAKAWLKGFLELLAKEGLLHTVLTEVFYWDDALLEALRAPHIGFGKNTFNGRTPNQVVIDGMNLVDELLTEFVFQNLLAQAA